MTGRGKSEYSQSVANALRLLGCFVEREERGISELSRELGLSKSAVARLVASLEAGRLLMQNAETGKYRLGAGFLLYGDLVRERSELSRALAPALTLLAEEYQATAHLAVLSGGELTIAAKVSAGPFRVYVLPAWAARCPSTPRPRQMPAGLDAKERAARCSTRPNCAASRTAPSRAARPWRRSFPLSSRAATPWTMARRTRASTASAARCSMPLAGAVAAVSVSGSRAALEPRRDEAVKFIRNLLREYGAGA